jgi:hypothetical protein
MSLACPVFTTCHDYIFYADPFEGYSWEGDEHYRLQDEHNSVLDPAQAHTYSDGFYDEIENRRCMLKLKSLMCFFIILCSFIFPILYLAVSGDPISTRP